MQASLAKVKTALLTITDEVYHYTAASNAAYPYIVWAEEATVAPLLTDNSHPADIYEGTIDYYTKDEHDDNFENIPAALNAAGIGWSLNSVQHEDETDFIHYEWIFRVRQTFGA